MHHRRKKRPNYGSIEVSRGEHGFGFTISGQQPCILSCIVPNSPADLAGLRSGDFLIAVNGLNVSKLPHESVVQLIGSSADRTIRLAIAETYYSDSSDDDDLVNQANQAQQRVRPKFPHHKLKVNRNTHNRLSLDGKKIINNNQTGEPKPSTSFAVDQNCNRSLPEPCNKLSNSSTKPKHELPFNLEACRTQRSLEYRTIVGYLGTIEMPKQIATSSKLQTVRSCIRKMRQEKRNPTVVLMTILPHCLTLKNHLNAMLAKYPNSRISFVSGNSENDKRFFGLVTSAMYADGVMCENGQSADSTDIIISNSCHVFVVDTKLAEHSVHLQKADEFRIICTKDPISDLCLEFPNNAEYVVNLIRSMYTLKPMHPNENERPRVARQLNMNESPNRRVYGADDGAGLLVANSPQPSNHSEITTTSSNSDSGIGFHNDCANISDRILVVDFPGLQNRQIANIRGNLRQPSSLLHARPVAIINDRSLLATGNIRTPGENASALCNYSPIVSLRSKSKSMDLINDSSPPKSNHSRPIRAAIASSAVPGCSKYINSPSQIHRTYDHEELANDPRSRSLQESNYPFRERPVDVPHNFQFNNPLNSRSSQLAARSCDDVMMAYSPSGSKHKQKTSNMRQSPIDDINFLGAAPKPPAAICKDDYVFLPPKPVRKSKKPSSYKQMKSSPSNKCSSKSVTISANSLRSRRCASASVENLMTNNKLCVRDKSDYESIWGSMQDIRRATMDPQSASTFLEGTYSEPDLTGFSTTSLCSILENMRSKYDTKIDDISVVLTVTTVLYCLGAIACGLVSKHVNRQLIAIVSLMAMAFSHYMAPHCPTKMIFFVVGGVLGTSLGFYDSTQIVWMIEIWQEASGPFIQTQHFCYAVGTIMSPLVIAPFLNADIQDVNSTTVSSSNSPSDGQGESRLYIPFSILGVFISMAFVFQIFLFVFYRYRTPPMYADENFKPIDDANDIMMEMERNKEEIVVSNNQQDGNVSFGGMNVRKAKLVVVTTIFIGLYLAMEVSTMQFIQIFGQYSDLKMTQSASAYVLTALTVMFAVGRGIGIVVIFKIRPELIICLNLFLIAVANLILLVWANGNLTMFWTASILLGIGQSTTFPSFCAFMEKYLVFTSGIASLVVVAATIGGAVYPLIIGSIIEKNVTVLTYTNYFSTAVCVIVMAVGYKWTRNSKNRAR